MDYSVVSWRSFSGDDSIGSKADEQLVDQLSGLIECSRVVMETAGRPSSPISFSP